MVYNPVLHGQNVKMGIFRHHYDWQDIFSDMTVQREYKLFMAENLPSLGPEKVKGSQVSTLWDKKEVLTICTITGMCDTINILISTDSAKLKQRPVVQSKILKTDLFYLWVLFNDWL